MRACSYIYVRINIYVQIYYAWYVSVYINVCVCLYSYILLVCNEHADFIYIVSADGK